MSQERRVCEQCRYFSTYIRRDEGWGECRRHAPIVGKFLSFPVVHIMDWCGEFQALEGKSMDEERRDHDKALRGP